MKIKEIKTEGEKSPSVKPKRSTGSAARVKGHSAERQIAKEMRDLGWKDAATTRATSRMLDNAKCDINFIKLNLQSKAVKNNLNYKNYIDLINEVNEGISKLPKEMLYRLTYPTVVFHKKDRQTLVIMTKEDFYTILKPYIKEDVQDK